MYTRRKQLTTRKRICSEVKRINPFYLKLNEAVYLALSAALLSCAFEKIGIDIFAWFAFLPFFLVTGKKAPKEAFFAGLFFGIVFYLLTIYWLVYTITYYGQINALLSFFICLLLVLYLAAYIGLFAMLLRFTAKRFDSLFLAPVIWVAMEYLKTYMLTGFPWNLIGYSIYKRTTIIQFADITGVYGLSFLILLVNYAIYRAYIYIKGDRQRKYLVEAAASILALIAVAAYGIHARDGNIINKDERIRVSVTQGNIRQDLKWDKDFRSEIIEIYNRLTIVSNAMIDRGAYSKASPKLIVWPETAAPFYMQNDTNARGNLLKLAKRTGAYMLVGALAFEADEENHEEYSLLNSAFLLSPDMTILGRYDKVHLVPFGEYVPLAKLLFFVNKLTEGIGDFSSGGSPKNLIMNDFGYSFATLICYESIFPNLTRGFVKDGADFLVNITNDAWFGKTSAPYQQISMAVLRAVENKRYLIRAANTGISAFIDPFGKITQRTGLFVEDVLTGEVATVNKMTFYSKHGDVFSQIISWILVMLIIASYRRKGA